MVGKVCLAIVAILAVAVYLTVQEEGSDEAFGGALAPIESVRAPNSGGDPLAGMVTGQSVPQTTQTDYGQMVNRVRERTNDAMARSVERSSR